MWYVAGAAGAGFCGRLFADIAAVFGGQPHIVFAVDYSKFIFVAILTQAVFFIFNDQQVCFRYCIVWPVTGLANDFTIAAQF